MTIVIGCDHAGLELKRFIISHLEKAGYSIIDVGTYSSDSCDYPDYAAKACKKVLSNEAELGILVCYTGIGMSMAANKFHGIRAALVTNIDAAKLTREHNDANILCLSSKDYKLDNSLEMVDVFLNTKFSFNERHERRIKKIKEIEESNE